MPQQPFHLMAKPAGPKCNLACRYCFYTEKETLYPDTHDFRMPDAVLETFIRQYIESQDTPAIHFAWQGGEPTLLGVGFFRKAVQLQQRYANGKRITNSLQTNGVLLDDEWCAFFREHSFLIGISIDGPRELHDIYRVDRGWHPTFDRVMLGLVLLKRHRVEFNTLTVVHRVNSRKPRQVYHFLKDIGSQYHQYIPLVERVADVKTSQSGFRLREPPNPRSENGHAPVTEWSVEPLQYGRFLTSIFDEWGQHDVGQVFVQAFDVMVGNWMRLGSSLCLFAETCGRAMALEHNGDVYACDNYVYPQYYLGNLTCQTLSEIAASPKQARFGEGKRDTLPRCCRECEFLFACNGECPKRRFLRTHDGESGLNYLCAGYQQFFRHIGPFMRVIAQLIDAGRPAADIMAMLSRVRVEAGRNTRPAASGRCKPVSGHPSGRRKKPAHGL